MANLVDQINTIESQSADKEKYYRDKIIQLDQEFEQTKQVLQDQSVQRVAIIKEEFVNEGTNEFNRIEAEYRRNSQAEIEVTEQHITNQRDELAKQIAMKVVDRLWQ